MRVRGTWCAALVLSAGAAVTLGQPLEKKDPPDPTAARPAIVPPSAIADASVERFADRIVREVRLVGLSKTDAQLVRNQIRVRDGAPLNPQIVRDDVQRLVRLARFKQIDARVQAFDDSSVLLIYEFLETPIIEDVQAVGNRQIADSELSPVISLLKGTPVDEFQLGAARSSIERLYRDKGYYQATVTVDQEELDKTGIVLFVIAEGEQVKVTDIRFSGNKSFAPSQLMPAIKTTTAGIFDSGPVDNEQLDRDVVSLVEFLRDRGYLDARADRRVIFSPNGREAIVEFVIDEGPVYTLRSVQFELIGASALVEPSDDEEEGEAAGAGGGGGSKPASRPTVFSVQQIAGLMDIKQGDVFGVNKVRRSMDTVKNAYLRMGYVDAAVVKFEKRDPAQPQVDLLIQVREGRPFKTGLIRVVRNDITQTKVPMRELDIKPDRPLDATTRRSGDRTVSESQVRIQETRLFAPNSVKLTFQPPTPEEPDHRDVLIEVAETNTGSVTFGAGVNSDLGVIGQISLTQRNFDIADVPDSFGEFFSGRAMRGAGQTFNLTIAPGTEVSRYTISLSDPSVFDTDYNAGGTLYYWTREYDEYDEQRAGGRVSVGRKFGERWGGSVFARYELVDISNIDDADATVDLLAVEGEHTMSGIGGQITRFTTDSRFRPTRGSRLQLGVERVGAMGGDYDFTKLDAQHTFYFPIYESFLGHKTVFSLKNEIGWIPEGQDESPLFERYYLGGTSFRGFAFRTISPKGVVAATGDVGDDPVGGSWKFFMGAEVQQPVWRDIVSVVGFIDTGTVTEQIGFDDYRVSGGFGLRLHIDALGPVPLAFDFGFPIVKAKGDRERVFSFTIDLPF